MTTARDSLLREREGYVRRGLDDRVAAVDAELAKLPDDNAASEAAEVETADEPQGDVETADEPTAKARRRK